MYRWHWYSKLVLGRQDGRSRLDGRPSEDRPEGWGAIWSRD